MSSYERKIIWEVVSGHLSDFTWIGEKQFRNHFEIPQNEKSVDGGYHLYRCETILAEQTKKKIREALQQFENVIDHIERLRMRNVDFNDYRVKECVLCCISLKEVEAYLFRGKDGYLYRKDNKEMYTIKNKIPVRIRYWRKR